MDKSRSPQKRQLVVQPVIYFAVFMFGMILRTMGAMRFGQQLQLYPHFNTPLIDPRELRETFDTYERTGQFFARPLQIGQSEMYLHFLYFMTQLMADSGLDGVFLTTAAFEAVSLMVQLIIFHFVYTATEKKDDFVTAALFFMTVNPI